MLITSLLGLISCSKQDTRFHDRELVEFNEAVAFDATSLERWNLYLTRLSIGISGQWPDFDDPEVKRRLMSRLDREHATARTRIIVMLWQHYPEAYDLIAANRLQAGSCAEDAILLTAVIQRHSSEASVDPASQRLWEHYVTALAGNPVRLDAAWRKYEPSIGKSRPDITELKHPRALAAEQEMRSPGAGIELRSTRGFWQVLVAAAEDPHRRLKPGVSCAPAAATQVRALSLPQLP